MSIRRVVVLGLVCVGCGDDASVPIDAAIDAVVIDAPPDAPPAPPRQIVAEVPATPNRNLDVLFVIDDSPSTADKQNNLANNFPNFINVLSSLPGGLPNLHLGVVTTDLGTKGSASPTPGPSIGQAGNGGCVGTGKGGVLQTRGAPVTSNFVSDLDGGGGGRIKNYTGTLASVFDTMARVGVGGCGFEQPLAAMRAALESTNTANAGFLRADAALAVVFITDEDDCSIASPAILGPESAALGPLQSFRCTRFGVTCATGGATPDEMNMVGPKSGCTGSVGSPYLDDVAPYRSFLVGLKGDTRRVVVGAIMAPTTPFSTELRSAPGGGTPVTALSHSCAYQGADGSNVGDPAVRMAEFLSLFPERSASSTICQQDLSGGLTAISQKISLSIGSPCLSVEIADVEPATVGIQPDCIVEDLLGATTTAIPACGSNGPATCWRLIPSAGTCTLADHLELVVTRAQAPDPATVTRMRCRLP
jgi:hypothetical protein